MRYLQQAFNEVCTEAKETTQNEWYVSLMKIEQRYGGPEEGGWWITDCIIAAYQKFTTQEAAEAAYEQVLKFAEELEKEAQREHGEHCLLSMEWLEARGLDADFLPEPDGPTKYRVELSEGLPEESFGPTHYE